MMDDTINKLAQELMDNHIDGWLSGGCNEEDRKELTNEIAEFLLKNHGDIRRSTIDECYDQFIECEDENDFTKWMNKELDDS